MYSTQHSPHTFHKRNFWNPLGVSQENPHISFSSAQDALHTMTHTPREGEFQGSRPFVPSMCQNDTWKLGVWPTHQTCSGIQECLGFRIHSENTATQRGRGAASGPGLRSDRVPIDSTRLPQRWALSFCSFYPGHSMGSRSW